MEWHGSKNWSFSTAWWKLLNHVFIIYYHDYIMYLWDLWECTYENVLMRMYLWECVLMRMYLWECTYDNVLMRMQLNEAWYEWSLNKTLFYKWVL